MQACLDDVLNDRSGGIVLFVLPLKLRLVPVEEFAGAGRLFPSTFWAKPSFSASKMERMSSSGTLRVADR